MQILGEGILSLHPLFINSITWNPEFSSGQPYSFLSYQPNSIIITMDVWGSIGVALIGTVMLLIGRWSVRVLAPRPIDEVFAIVRRRQWDEERALEVSDGRSVANEKGLTLGRRTIWVIV